MVSVSREELVWVGLLAKEGVNTLSGSLSDLPGKCFRWKGKTEL